MVVVSTKVDAMETDEAITAIGTEDPAEGLAAVVALRRLADRLEDEHVERAFRAAWSWTDIADALGVTRQAAHKKHAKRLKAAGVDFGKGEDVPPVRS